MSNGFEGCPGPGTRTDIKEKSTNIFDKMRARGGLVQIVKDSIKHPTSPIPKWISNPAKRTAEPLTASQLPSIDKINRTDFVDVVAEASPTNKDKLGIHHRTEAKDRSLGKVEIAKTYKEMQIFWGKQYSILLAMYPDPTDSKKVIIPRDSPEYNKWLIIQKFIEPTSGEMTETKMKQAFENDAEMWNLSITMMQAELIDLQMLRGTIQRRYARDVDVPTGALNTIDVQKDSLPIAAGKFAAWLTASGLAITAIPPNGFHFLYTKVNELGDTINSFATLTVPQIQQMLTAHPEYGPVLALAFSAAGIAIPKAVFAGGNFINTHTKNNIDYQELMTNCSAVHFALKNTPQYLHRKDYFRQAYAVNIDDLSWDAIKGKMVLKDRSTSTGLDSLNQNIGSISDTIRSFYRDILHIDYDKGFASDLEAMVNTDGSLRNNILLSQRASVFMKEVMIEFDNLGGYMDEKVDPLAGAEAIARLRQAHEAVISAKVSRRVHEVVVADRVGKENESVEGTHNSNLAEIKRKKTAFEAGGAERKKRRELTDKAHKKFLELNEGVKDTTGVVVEKGLSETGTYIMSNEVVAEANTFASELAKLMGKRGEVYGYLKDKTGWPSIIDILPHTDITITNVNEVSCDEIDKLITKLEAQFTPATGNAAQRLADAITAVADAKLPANYKTVDVYDKGILVSSTTSEDTVKVDEAKKEVVKCTEVLNQIKLHISSLKSLKTGLQNEISRFTSKTEDPNKQLESANEIFRGEYNRVIALGDFANNDDAIAQLVAYPNNTYGGVTGIEAIMQNFGTPRGGRAEAWPLADVDKHVHRMELMRAITWAKWVDQEAKPPFSTDNATLKTGWDKLFVSGSRVIDIPTTLAYTPAELFANRGTATIADANEASLAQQYERRRQALLQKVWQDTMKANDTQAATKKKDVDLIDKQCETSVETITVAETMFSTDNAKRIAKQAAVGGFATNPDAARRLGSAIQLIALTPDQISALDVDQEAIDVLKTKGATVGELKLLQLLFDYKKGGDRKKLLSTLEALTINDINGNPIKRREILAKALCKAAPELDKWYDFTTIPSSTPYIDSLDLALHALRVLMNPEQYKIDSATPDPLLVQLDSCRRPSLVNPPNQRLSLYRTSTIFTDTYDQLAKEVSNNHFA